MKIARIRSLTNPVPIGYGGTQRVMAQLTALQAAMCGDDITLHNNSINSAYLAIPT